MSDIEKRARELLGLDVMSRTCTVQAMNIGRGGLSIMYAAEISAIAKALAPAGDYVLIKASTLADLADDAEALIIQTEFRRDRIEGKLALVREARNALAARPEVSGG